jgi:hypothetical protein
VKPSEVKAWKAPGLAVGAELLCRDHPTQTTKVFVQCPARELQVSVGERGTGKLGGMQHDGDFEDSVSHRGGGLVTRTGCVGTQQATEILSGMDGW